MNIEAGGNLKISFSGTEQIDLDELRSTFRFWFIYRVVFIFPLFLFIIDFGIYRTLSYLSLNPDVIKNQIILFLVSTLQISFAVLWTFAICKLYILDIRNYLSALKLFDFLRAPKNVQAYAEICEALGNGMTLFTFYHKEHLFYVGGWWLFYLSPKKLQFAILDLRADLTIDDIYIADEPFGAKGQLSIRYRSLSGRVEKLHIESRLNRGDFEHFYQIAQILNKPRTEGDSSMGLKLKDADEVAEIKAFWDSYKNEKDQLAKKQVNNYLKLVLDLDAEKKLNRQTLAYLVADCVLSLNESVKQDYEHLLEEALDLEKSIADATEDGTEEAYNRQWNVLSEKIRQILQ